MPEPESPNRTSAPLTEAEELPHGLFAKHGLLGAWHTLWPGNDKRAAYLRLTIALALLATLGGLLLHARFYSFLTDDAYISFRYARNFSQGQGLVYNPGFEAVEGYTNFLWVLLISFFASLGISVEKAALGMSYLSTALLWALMLGYVLRHPPKRQRFFILAPLVLLAATRSVAVWSTGGLETRFFEALLLGALLRFADEVQALKKNRPLRPLSALLFSLTILTRPEGLMLTGTVWLVGTLALFGDLKFPWRWMVLWCGVVLFAAGGQLTFRWFYYHDIFPNTFYAKVNPHGWWEMGFTYLTAFCLEYAAYLWIPLVLLGTLYLKQQGRLLWAIILMAAIIPHALYIARLGGDYFEYRSLDFYFPLAYLLVYEGAIYLDRRGWRGSVTALILLGLMLVGIVWLPYQSHRQFPQKHLAGFPGQMTAPGAGKGFLDPKRDALYRHFGLATIGQAYVDRLRKMTVHFVGIRQEEHKLTLKTSKPVAARLKRLVERRILPRDLYIALHGAGYIPFITNFRTFDVHGLTERQVARMQAHTPQRLLAHERLASIALARRKKVDLWTLHPQAIIVHYQSPEAALLYRLSPLLPEPIYAAGLGGGWFLAGHLPLGLEHAKRRFPKLEFFPLTNAKALQKALAQSLAKPDPFESLSIPCKRCR